MDFIPDKSEIQLENIKVDRDKVLKDLIKDLGIRKHIPAMNRPRVQQERKQWASLTAWCVEESNI